MKLTLRQAYLSEGEEIAIEEAEGRVLKRAVYAYPPGVPLMAPGEVISREIIDYIKERNLEGIENGKIAVVDRS